MRVVLANLNAGDSDSGVLDMALAVARPHGAHIRALHAREDPRLLAVLASPEAASVIGTVIRAGEQEAADAARRARRSWSEWRSGNGVIEAASPPAPGAAAPADPAPTTEYLDILGDWPQAVGIAGRFADLVVLARGDVGDTGAACEAALFTSGRPVLIVPAAYRTAIDSAPLDTIIIAWNDRAEASRAVAGAMPLLRRARRIQVLHRAEGERSTLQLEPVLAHLRWHGLAPAGAVLPPAPEPIAETLTEAALRAGAGLIVMGAYGHGRLRELVFGGVTRHMLEHARLPVLMMH